MKMLTQIFQRSPNSLHPPLQLRLTSPEEPGFILERIPVHTIREIWGILEVSLAKTAELIVSHLICFLYPRLSVNNAGLMKYFSAHTGRPRASNRKRKTSLRTTQPRQRKSSRRSYQVRTRSPPPSISTPNRLMHRAHRDIRPAQDPRERLPPRPRTGGQPVRARARGGTQDCDVVA